MFHLRRPFSSLGQQRIGVKRDHYAEHDNAQLSTNAEEERKLVECFHLGVDSWTECDEEQPNVSRFCRRCYAAQGDVTTPKRPILLSPSRPEPAILVHTQLTEADMGMVIWPGEMEFWERRQAAQKQLREERERQVKQEVYATKKPLHTGQPRTPAKRRLWDSQ